MFDIIIGEKVINKQGEAGTIISSDDCYIYVDYGTRSVKLLLNAFEKGFIKYENAQLQSQSAKKAEVDKEAEEHRAAEAQKQWLTRSMVNMPVCNVEKTKVHFSYDRALPNLAGLPKDEQDLLRAIFIECDNETKALYDSFEPKMEYPKNTSKARSKYSTGFLTKYRDTYVLRVFWRNDIYKKGVRAGVTLLESYNAEVMRFLMVKGHFYAFFKNVKNTWGHVTLTTKNSRWQEARLQNCILINEVVRKCDCNYLNDYIEVKDVDSYLYAHLLFPALYNNKAEIVFKNKLYLSTYRIKDLIGYLEPFTSKQIDFASRNNVINALPIIKDYGIRDLDVLRKMEEIMKIKYYNSIYGTLKKMFAKRGFDHTDLCKRLIDFSKRTSNLNIGVYWDYIFELDRQQGITINDFFDKDYNERLTELLMDKNVCYSIAEAEHYAGVAKELSWIDREENGYFIMVPKTIEEFKFEGQQQHNCVFKCRYFDDVMSRTSIIVFLRKEKDVPFVTIEYDYDTFEVLQALGKYNQKLSEELENYIVELGKRLRREASI